ncbi:MAG TPA: lytic transglycosylase domain-containing protein, partial [Stenotrophomonas sp.]
MKGILGITGILAAALVALPASAGTLYKCVGSDGVPNYVSKRVSGASCSVVSNYRPTREAPRYVPPAPTAVPAPVVAPVTAAATPAGPAANSGSSTAVAAQAAPTAVPATPAPAPVSRAQRVVSGQVYSYMKDGVRHYTSSRPAQVANIGAVRTIQYSYIERCFACGVNSRV